MPKLFKVSKCTTRSGNGMKDNGWAYKKCVKEIDPPVEKVIHGANPNKGHPEIKQNILSEQYNIINQENKGNKMSFKKRIQEPLEESFLKKVDRALHQSDYQRLTQNIHKTRAQIRQLQEEIQGLEQNYQANKLSPQAAAIQSEIETKKSSLRNAQQQLEVYKDLGRRGLDIDPFDYQMEKSKDEGRLQGALTGLAAGGIGGLALGNAFSESTIIEENTKSKKKVDPQAELFKELTQKEKLKAGYIHTDVGEDNSFFITKKDFDDWKNQLENPNAWMLEIEKQNPKEKKIRLRLLKEIKNMKKNHKNIDDGVVLMGKGPKFGNKPEILAHELGHAQNHKEKPYLGTLRHPLLTGLTGALGGGLIALGHPVTGGAVILAGQGGTLYDEGKASLRGYKNLKELEKDPKKGDLAHGFGSYVVAGGIPAAFGEYANLRNPHLERIDNGTFVDDLW